MDTIINEKQGYGFTEELAESAIRKMTSKKTSNHIDSDSQIVYNKKYKKKRAYYSQYHTTAMQWAFSSKTKLGDIKVLYNPQDNTWNKLVADDTEDGYGTLLSIKDTLENTEAIRNLYDEVYNENHG